MKTSIIFFLFVLVNVAVLAQKKIEIFTTVDGKKFTRHQRDSIEKLGNFIGVKEKRENKDTLFTSIFYYDKQLLLTPLQRRFIGKIFPAINLPSMEYDTVCIDKMRGKVIMLIVWSPSMGEDVMVQLNDLVEHYRDSEVSFIAIASKTEAEMRSELKVFRFNFVTVPDAKVFINKYGMEESSFYFIDRKGITQQLSTGIPVDMRYKPDGTTRHEGEDFKIIVYEYFSKVLDELLNGEQN